MSDNSKTKQGDLVEELDDLLDEEDASLTNDYVGVSKIYRCISCGHEQIVKNLDIGDISCDECGGDMQEVDEEIYDAQQKKNEDDSGTTELEDMQDETEDTINYKKTDDNVGNTFDADEADEIPDLKDLEDMEPSEDDLLELESENLNNILV